MLFDNNDDNGFDYTFLDLAGLTSGMNNNYSNMNMNSNNDLNLYSSKEGFLRGNMFRDEYKPYKYLTFVNIVPKNDREAKMFNVMQYAFAITDMNLYLDLNPNDTKAVNLLKELIRAEKDAKEEYERTYGPLEVCDVKGNTFDWIKGPWSWEDGNGGGMYV